ncbi:MAG TPA: helicase-related protein, partial [Ktedonobacteraceae bacterium]|nr:helicase-related protein [Ktedonobacteraceae bacterium]
SSFTRSDFEKLARLSSEGRSTATTVLSLSALRHLRAARARGEELTIQPKMLSFTDNRQDASLQAGHFNDFVEIGLLRSALYRAVARSGTAGIRHEQLTQRVLEALELDPKEYSVNPDAKYSARINAERAMRHVLGYRLYLDLRRGWRITSPNLEQCGLLEMAYQDLPEVCADEDLWQTRHQALRSLPADSRLEVCKTLLDYMRRELAIKVDYLDPARSEELKQQSSQHLVAPWALDEDEDLLYATRLFPRKREQGDDRSERYLSGLSSYGRYVRRVLRRQDREVGVPDIQQVIRDLLATLEQVGLVEEVVEARGKGENAVPGYQLPASTMIWRAGNGTGAYHDPLRMPALPQEQEKRINPFFARFYRENAEHLEYIQHLQAAEHTAQVPAERREKREFDFRFHPDVLPILYCSPTMELGVDIAELNVVNMRNIPPTPANYAQRSGRAGRGGQPALVFAYCSTGSSHDQYFFQHPGEMVSGAVSPPRLDLANEDLLRAHVHAIWLAESGLSLGDSLRDLLDIAGDEPTLALKDEVLAALRTRETRHKAEVSARAMFKTLEKEIDSVRAPWYTPNWLTDVLNHVEQSFENACERWRGLYRAAQAQRDTQNAIIRDTSRTEVDKKLARRLRTEAESQLDLLTASNPSERT